MIDGVAAEAVVRAAQIRSASAELGAAPPALSGLQRAKGDMVAVIGMAVIFAAHAGPVHLVMMVTVSGQHGSARVLVVALVSTVQGAEGEDAIQT